MRTRDVHFLDQTTKYSLGAITVAAGTIAIALLLLLLTF